MVGIMGNKKLKRLILTIVVLLIAISIFTVFYLNQLNSKSLEVYNQIPPFELQSSTGEMYSSNNEKIKVLTFFLINCPDGVCPMTMVDFADLQKELKEKGWFGKEVELLAITFDPKRDQLQDLQNYSESFHADSEGWNFVRGSDEEIKEISDRLKYFYHIGEDGSAIHPTTMYIIDGQHQIRAYHKMTTTSVPMDKERIMEDLKKLVKER